MDLQGKIVLITGATGGIGKELCRAFAREGAKVIPVSRSEEETRVLAGEVGATLHYACDFTKQKDVSRTLAGIKRDLTRLDILVNCAGIGVYKPFSAASPEEWNDSLAINVTAPFLFIKELLPVLGRTDAPVVVNVGSGMGKIPTAGRSLYCASKFALRGLSLSLSEEYKDTKTKVCHIDLGSTLTDFGGVSIEEKKRNQEEGKRKYFTPEWVAEELVRILKNDEVRPEITLYPGDYEQQTTRASKHEPAR